MKKKYVSNAVMLARRFCFSVFIVIVVRIACQILIEHRTQLSSSTFNQAAIFLYDRIATTTKVQSRIIPEGMLNRAIARTQGRCCSPFIQPIDRHARLEEKRQNFSGCSVMRCVMQKSLPTART
jgi:hypothetical protein